MAYLEIGQGGGHIKGSEERSPPALGPMAVLFWGLWGEPPEAENLNWNLN